METILTWIVDNWDGIFKWFGVAVTTSSLVIKATPTQKDDGLWGKALKVLDYISIVNTPSNKEKLAKLAKKGK